MSKLTSALITLEAEHSNRETAKALSKSFRQISRGYGFICCECRCEVDEHVRGPHLPGCSLARHNRSIMPGWEAFVEFIQDDDDAL